MARIVGVFTILPPMRNTRDKISPGVTSHTYDFRIWKIGKELRDTVDMMNIRQISSRPKIRKKKGTDTSANSTAVAPRRFSHHALNLLRSRGARMPSCNVIVVTHTDPFDQVRCLPDVGDQPVSRICRILCIRVRETVRTVNQLLSDSAFTPVC